MDICEEYLAEVRRLYGDACADASLCRRLGNGEYLVAVADTRSENDLRAMIARLKVRKPLLIDLVEQRNEGRN